MNSKLLIILTFIFLTSSCKKDEETCNNPDAVNKGNTGGCIFPSDQVKGAWGMRLVEYPLQPVHEGETWAFDIRDSYCYGPEAGYKYIQFFSLQSPFDPSDFCLLLNGYTFTITADMNITFAYAKVTGTGMLTPDGHFAFNGIIHQLSGDEWLIRLDGGR